MKASREQDILLVISVVCLAGVYRAMYLGLDSAYSVILFVVSSIVGVTTAILVLLKK